MAPTFQHSMHEHAQFAVKYDALMQLFYPKGYFGTFFTIKAEHPFLCAIFLNGTL